MSSDLCRLCKRAPAELTLEHIPPKSTGNRGRIGVEVYGHRGQGRVLRAERNGIGLRVLCERCNRREGRRLGTEYGKFVRQVRLSGRIGLPRRRVYVEANAVFPQRVVRQLYLSFLCLASVKDEAMLDSLREFVREDGAPLPDDAPRISLYHNQSGTFRVAPVCGILSLGGRGRGPGWRWHGAEVVHPGLGAIYTFPEDEEPPRAGPPFLSETADVTGWSSYGYGDRAAVRLDLPSWRVEHPHPLGFGRPAQVERWTEREHLAWTLTADDDSDELLRSGGSVLWRGR